MPGLQRERGDAVSDTEQKEMWALVELFGHQRIAGKVTQAEIGSGDLIRVDVPAVKDRAPLTKYYNVKAIYGITPVDEATATRMAGSINAAPISEWVLEREVERLRGRQLHSGDAEEEEESVL
jgi:hypothetical protein